MHAFVYADNWKNIGSKFVEGGLYIITNFYIKDALSSLKPVSSKTIINFSPSTSVEHLTEDDFMIPIHKFEFIDLSDLFSVANSYGAIKNPEYSAGMIIILILL